jgi:SAM-dependent methyltransferase
MVEIPFAAFDISSEQMRAAAIGLEDKACAEMVLEKGLEKVQSGSGSWLPRLILAAAQRLGRSAEVLPLYERFLEIIDTKTRGDWQSAFADSAPADDVFGQSGRYGMPAEAFKTEYTRVVSNLAPVQGQPILDVGCAGGLWAINLAKDGYEVIGTDRHAGIVEAAWQNAETSGVAHKLNFFVDDALNSTLPPGYYCSRVICISLTNGLPNDAAFESLIANLDRVSRPKGANPAERRVILGHNRWAPSRMSAVNETLIAEADNYANMVIRLLMIEATWWMHPRHLDAIKRWFPGVTHIGESVHKLDGVRVDLLLQ